MILTLPVAFDASFAGNVSIYAKPTDRTGASAEWAAVGQWTVVPIQPAAEAMTSTCADPDREAGYVLSQVPARDGRSAGLAQIPECFPKTTHYVEQGGWFLDDGRAVPVMGRVSGHFSVLVAFVDSAANRERLLANTSVPDDVKAMIRDARIEAAWRLWLSRFTADAIAAGVATSVGRVTSFRFDVAIASDPHAVLEYRDRGLNFSGYDAVAIVDELGSVSGIGVRRWPWDRHLFDGRPGAGFFLNLSPSWISPALVGRELLGRNVPNLLSEYVFGERTLVTDNGVTYDRTPMFNPRTGENIEPLLRAYEGKTPLYVYIAGYGDIDRDGVIDCIDPFIEASAENVDGDFIPDRFDPDLRVNHRPLHWFYAAPPR